MNLPAGSVSARRIVPAAPVHHAAMLRVLRHVRMARCVLPDADPRPASAAPPPAAAVPRAA